METLSITIHRGVATVSQDEGLPTVELALGVLSDGNDARDGQVKWVR